jgi:hypothetical protein
VTPATVTAPAGGSAGFKVGLTNNSVKPGKHDFVIVGTSGALSARYTFPFDLKAPAPANGPDSSVSASCGALPNGQIDRGQTVSVSCEFVATPAFHGTVALTCYSPSYVACRPTPESVSPREGAPARTTVTLTASSTADYGQTEFTISGISPDFNSNKMARSTVVFKVAMPPPPPAQPPVANYYFVCPESFTTIQAGSARHNLCIAHSDSWEGALNLGLSGAGPSGPKVSLATNRVEIRPGADQIATLIIDAASTVPGTYTFNVTAQPEGAPGPGSSQRITVQITEPGS